MSVILTMALAIRVVMDICFKMSVRHVSFESGRWLDGFKQVVSSLAFWLAVVTAGINFWLWMMVLSHYDLSFAYPLFGVCFALIMLSGRLFFSETLDANKLIGIGFVLLSSGVLIFG